MKVSAQYAEEHFADLLVVASGGEEIEIALPDERSLKLTIASPADRQLGSRQRILGAGRGELRVPGEDEWRAMDEEMQRQMTRAELTTPDAP